jgi:hypothetical protein
MADAASVIAGWLDWEMLRTRKVIIAEAGEPAASLPMKRGEDVFAELGGRFLLHYLVRANLGRWLNGADRSIYTTPTPLAPRETLINLVLPGPQEPRQYFLMLDPREIPTIAGPQWVAAHTGIQYILPDGFPRSAIVVPGASRSEDKWELVVG